MPNRRHVHTRSIHANVYARDDGLWDVEAEMSDTKPRDFELASGVRPAGSAIHRMRLCVTIDTSFTIVSANASSLDHPYPGHCDVIEPVYRQLVGLNLMKGFKRAVRERFGGVAGCTHITELADVLPTSAVQAFAGEVIKHRDGFESAQDDRGNPTKPFQLDRCHALRSDAPAVARFYPRWYRPATSDSPDTNVESQT